MVPRGNGNELFSNFSVSKNPPIVPHAHGTEPDVKIGEPDPAQTRPCPDHVPPVEATGAGIDFVTRGRFGKLVEKTADEMTEGVASERVTAEEHDVDGQHQRADAEAKFFCAGNGIGKPQRFPNVRSQQQNKNESNVKKVAMDVLHDQRKRFFAQIFFARFADGARGRVGPERFVISAAIIITGETKAARRPEDEQGGRKNHPAGPPRRFGSEPTVRRITKNFRRIKRGEVGTESVMAALEGSPGGINDEGRQTEKYEDRLQPPVIAAHGLAKGTLVG